MSDNKHAYTKSRLVKELAFKAGIKKTASQKILETLAEIIKRETPNAPFILPGVCKFELVPRKERRIRNPRTGEPMVLPPQNALKVTASRSAKMAIAPRIPAVPAAQYNPPAEVQAPAEVQVPTEVQAPAEAKQEPIAVPVSSEVPPVVQPFAEPAPVVAAEEPAPVVAAEEPAPVVAAEEPAPEAAVEEPAPEAAAEEPAPEAAEEPAPVAAAEEPAPAEEVEAGPVSFRCPECGQEIEAPAEAIGLDAECPMCGSVVVVPAKSEAGTMYAPGDAGEEKAHEEVVSSQQAEEMDPAVLKNRTIRIDTEALGLDGPKPAPEPGKPISFLCRNCQQEIEATSDMAGSMAECPNCGFTFEIPAFSESGTLHDANAEQKKSDETEQQAAAQKRRTMRIELPDDF